MTRDEKKVIIDSLTEKLKENPFFYITDASGWFRPGDGNVVGVPWLIGWPRKYPIAL